MYRLVSFDRKLSNKTIQHFDLTIAQQTDLDWLMYNEPREYMQMLLSGTVMD